MTIDAMTATSRQLEQLVNQTETATWETVEKLSLLDPVVAAVVTAHRSSDGTTREQALARMVLLLALDADTLRRALVRQAERSRPPPMVVSCQGQRDGCPLAKEQR
jgi:hypothetical protein